MLVVGIQYSNRTAGVLVIIVDQEIATKLITQLVGKVRVLSWLPW